MPAPSWFTNGHAPPDDGKLRYVLETEYIGSSWESSQDAKEKLGEIEKLVRRHVSVIGVTSSPARNPGSGRPGEGWSQEFLLDTDDEGAATRVMRTLQSRRSPADRAQLEVSGENYGRSRIVMGTTMASRVVTAWLSDLTQLWSAHQAWWRTDGNTLCSSSQM